MVKILFFLLSNDVNSNFCLTDAPNSLSHSLTHDVAHSSAISLKIKYAYMYFKINSLMYEQIILFWYWQV